MKLYISIPITGRPIADAKYQAEVIRNKLRLHGHECVTPFDICPESGKPYAYYMGRDIEALIECDAIMRCAGWSNSKGCHLESECAHIYHKIIYDHVNEIKPINNNKSNKS